MFCVKLIPRAVRCAAIGLVTVLAAWSAHADRWIVETEIAPLAQRAPTSEATVHAEQRAHVEQRLHEVLDRIDTDLKRRATPVHTYRHVLAGFALSLSDAEADIVAAVPGVRRVTRDTHYSLNASTPGVPLTAGAARTQGSEIFEPVTQLVGAAAVWDGAAPDGLPHLGEGVVVGMTGSGVRGDHPSFAAMGDDGYQHVNPLGSGNYLGECFATPEVICNDKLIGRYAFTFDSTDTSEDEDGYSTYLASLAVGNRLSGDTVDATGLSLVAGVAPHANLIVYRNCAPTCASSDTLRAFDQAIQDGVDVLLHPLGSSPTSPWDDVLALAARSMRAAGIVLVTSTGSQGPAPATINLSLSAPWVVSANPSTHGVDYAAKTLDQFAGGVQPAPPPLFGRSVGGVVAGRIVYAGNIPNPAAPGQDPAQCLTPYPAGTLNGEILVCDRGEIARLQKSINARDSGAGGFVLANTADGPDNIAQDIYALPGIHIDAASGDALRAWLAEGSDHTAAVGFAAPDVDPARQDLLSSAASRGPNLGLSYLAPMLTAPAFDVVGATLAPETFVLSSARGNTPTVGALALLRSVHPEWTASERISALMTTAVAPLREFDAKTPTGPFDHGAGRIDVAAATRAGLVLDVTDEQFVAADPATGGRPQDLNLAGLVDLDCLGGCEFVRTVRATVDGAWSSVASGDDVQVSVTPATFALAAGETQSLTISVAASEGRPDADYSGALVFAPQSDDVSSTTFPVAIAWRADEDSDAVADAVDNCLARANADQRDTDGDGFGNACDGDLNNDLRTNVIDLGLFRVRFGTSDPDADFNADGAVDSADLDILRDLFLQPPGPSGQN